MEALGPACECLKCLWVPLARQLSYVKDFNKNLRELNTGMKVLCDRREDIDTEICKYSPLKMPSKECQAWLAEVKQTENQVKDIKTKITANGRCLNVCCFPDILPHRKLGKRIVTMLDDVTKLQARSAFKGEMLVDAPPQIVERIPVPSIGGQTTTDRLVQEILKCIRDEKICKIGLWGMGGVGKTTVMKSLNNLPEIALTFDLVIWVTASKDCSVRKVQNEIAKRCRINMVDHDSDYGVATRLFESLQKKKYLLLLDDVWNQVNLEDVGIPMPNEETGNKLVLTSRSRDVCNQMGTDEEIKVEALSKDEAWRLFHDKVGDVIDSPNIEPLARQVVEECDGLPLAITVIGGSMTKKKEVHAWRNALEELRSASFGIRNMEDKVFNRLKFSYDQLKYDNIKNCFLYCALYPEDYEIPVDELVTHWRDEGFIKGVQSFDKAYDKACTILDGLVDDSLLERGVRGGVKMHDVVRDLALRITSPNGEGPKFLVRAGVGIEEWENAAEWEKAERISLMENRLSRLPASPICNSLCTLLLQGNGRLEMLPEFFFQHMQSLRVLNLCSTRISVLPPSVSSLVNLRALYIKYDRYIKLTLPSEIGCLKSLEVLHMGCVTSLPIEVRELTSLKSMRMGFAGDAEQALSVMFCDGVISSLRLLEDLRFYFITDSLLQQWNTTINVRVVEEVGSLKHLTSLLFEFPTTECLDHFVKKRRTMNCPKLTKFFLSVQGDVHGLSYEKAVMGKELQWYSGETIKSSGMVEVLSQAFVFSLVGHKTVEKLSDFGKAIVLPNLQRLILQWCPKMRSIWDDSIPPPPSFPALRDLQINRCRNLRSVFTWGAIQHMPNLEKLSIMWCENMEEIVAVREAEDQVVDDVVLFFPGLKELKLYNMDKLVRIWKGVSSQPWPSLEEVIVSECPNLKTLNLKLPANDHHNASSSSSSSTLRKIRGQREWWEALEWEHSDDRRLLQPLFTVMGTFRTLWDVFC